MIAGRNISFDSEDLFLDKIHFISIKFACDTTKALTGNDVMEYERNCTYNSAMKLKQLLAKIIIIEQVTDFL